jgi:hypothetical protein
LFHLGLARLIQHCGREVNAGRVTDHMGKGTSQQTGTTSYVEGSIVWAGLGQSDDMIQRFFIPDRLRLRKGRRLTGELVKDAIVVGVHEGYGTASDGATTANQRHLVTYKCSGSERGDLICRSMSILCNSA